MIRSLLATTVAAVFFATCEQASADTDALQQVNALLASYGSVAVTTTVMQPKTTTVCTDLSEGTFSHRTVCNTVTQNVPVQVTTQAPIHATGISIISVDPITFGKSVVTAFPDQFIAIGEDELNCGPSTATFTVSLQQQVTHTESVAISNTIVHASTKSVGLSVPLAGVATLSGTLQIQDQSTSGTVNTDQTAISNTRTGSGTTPVPAQSDIVGELRTWPVRYTIPFHTTATIDASLSANDKGLTTLSQIASLADRTFPIDGSIDATEASEGTIVFYSAPFNASACPASGSPVVTRPFTYDGRVQLQRVLRASQ